MTRERNNEPFVFFIYGPQCVIVWLFWESSFKSVPIYHLAYINLHIKYGSKPIILFSYCEKNEVSERGSVLTTKPYYSHQISFVAHIQ